MKLSDDLAYMTATELARRIRSRQLSPVEVVDAFIGRIEERNPSLNAFVYRPFSGFERCMLVETSGGGAFPVLKAVPKSTSRYSPNVDEF
jgi:hypothetical protein